MPCLIQLTSHTSLEGTTFGAIKSILHILDWIPSHFRPSRLKEAFLFPILINVSWWRHQIETFSALLARCAGNSPVPAQRPVTRGFNVFFDLRLNRGLSKQSWGWWFETLSRPLWHHRNVLKRLAPVYQCAAVFYVIHMMIHSSVLMIFTSFTDALY